MEEDAPEECFKKAIEAEFKKGGIEALKNYVESNLDQWKSATVSIGVIGRTGVGKSTFINVFRNVKDDEKGAALTGATETTTEIKSYKDPINPNIQLFDLPGVGTEMAPKNEYFKMIQVDHFDTFLLMTATRFTENDTWLADTLKAKGKQFFFVRTKVWNDVENKNRNVSVRIPEDQIIDEIRKDCKEKTKSENDKIFLIDSFNQRNEKLDFTRLRIAMSESLPDLKNEALLDTFRDFTMFTPILIINKGKMLRKRIRKASLLSGLFGLIPIPGVSMSVDLGIVCKERSFIANQLGIRQHGISFNGLILSEVTGRNIKETVAIWWKDLSGEVLKGLLLSGGVEKAVSFIPGIGILVAGAISCIGTYAVLDTLLDKMINDALNVNTLIRIELAKSFEV